LVDGIAIDVHRLQLPYISALVLLIAFVHTIPTSSLLGGGIYQLAVPIEQGEVFQLLDAYQYRPGHIVQPIAIGRKGIGHKYIPNQSGMLYQPSLYTQKKAA
jgi:hypothetical protein